MLVISLILYLAAAVCFAVAIVNAGRRFNLVAAGLLACVLVHLIDAIAAVV